MVASTSFTVAPASVEPSTSSVHSSLPFSPATTVAVPNSLPSRVTVTMSPAFASPPTVPLIATVDVDSSAFSTLSSATEVISTVTSKTASL